MPDIPKKPIVYTLIGIAAFLFIAQPHLFGGSTAILFLLFWLPYTLIGGWCSRKQPKIWVIKLLCWLAAFAALSAIHYAYNREARIYAQKMVDDIISYRAKHGRYPTQESWNAQHRQNSYSLRYLCGKECANNRMPPIVLYPSSLSPFDRYDYDFEKQTWQRHND